MFSRYVAWFGIGVVAAFCCASCAAPSVTYRETTGAQLPVGLEFPAFQGDVAQVADQLCDWVSMVQKPFSDSELETVYVTDLTGVENARYEAAGLLNAFLQRDQPRELVVQLDPAAILVRSTEFRAVYDRIDRPTIWSFSRVEEARCATSATAVRVMYERSTHCIQVMPLPDPPSEAIEADFRNLNYVLSIGSVQQPVAVQVMTLTERDNLVGRVVAARLWADGPQTGAMRRVCEPALYVEGFESARAQQ